MRTLGARLGQVAPGDVDIELDWAAGLTQQHGFLHAGVVATMGCTLMDVTGRANIRH
jgi:acyl-coenzyme A thioesterase PaaI-like protein